MSMGYAVDGRVNVGISEGHIECDGLQIVRVCDCLSDGLGLVRTRPFLAPRYLTRLARFPTDSSG